ncbi:MAG: HlyD family type I secretion periplasmic adaptor subunit [Alphaproteobacteria bacterium]|jgi:adhesin transport system membrane fusion protein|nr:HlyD family type I secretion periplasmic adaptor subunit [Alphaproteobacteria bacterium]
MSPSSKPISKKAPSLKPEKAVGDELNINREGDWDKIQQNWLKQRADKLDAYAQRYFMADDELPLHRHILLMVISLFFIVFVLWASFATLDETARGEGQVIPAGEVQVIQNLEGGIVDQFLFKEGDQVKAGDVIMRLRDVGANSDLGANESRYLGLLASTIRLQAEVEGKASVEFPDDVTQKAPQSVTEELNAFRTNREKLQGQTMVLEQQLAQRKQEIVEMTTKASDLRAIIRLSQEEKRMIEPLVAKGSAPKVELIQLERALREKQTELNSVTEAIPRAKSAISEAEARISELRKTGVAQAQTELAAKTAEMNMVKQTLGALEDKKDRTEIKSPVNGTIKDFKINTVGGVVKAGDPIVEIVPVDDNLLVEVKIRPADIGRLRPDLPAMVKITAYDFTIYGGLKAEVVDISADTIKNEKGESFYRVRVRTKENKLRRNGEDLPIIPGMVATVDVLTGHKTVMEYLMKPILKTARNSMNEK